MRKAGRAGPAHLILAGRRALLCLQARETNPAPKSRHQGDPSLEVTAKQWARQMKGKKKRQVWKSSSEFADRLPSHLTIFKKLYEPLYNLK